MDILSYVQIGLVLGVVIVIQTIKNIIDADRRRKTKARIQGSVWLLIVVLCGPLLSIIVSGIEEFKNFNFFIFLRDAFIYSAASTFLYKVYKVSKEKIIK
jgi:hypothetical protein